MTTNSIFMDVKERLNLREVAEYYGVDVNRGGFINCPSHDDRTPSMKLYDDHFHCYGCGCHGDVTDLTAILFNLSSIEAARKLACDFGIIVDDHKPDKSTIKAKLTYYSYAAEEQRVYNLLRNYCDFLGECRRELAPVDIGEELHPLFVHAITETEKFEYYKDIFITGSKDERKAFISDFSGVLGEIERGFNKAKTCQAVEMA